MKTSARAEWILHAGDVVLQKGRRLKPQDLGLLAMLGIAKVQVHKKPRVALLSSGDELLEVDAPLTAGKDTRLKFIYARRTDRKCRRGSIATWAWQKIHANRWTGLLEKAVNEKVDLILSSAGVSVGAFDFVKEVIESNGKMDFWRVNMRPGKPLAFGEYRGKPFIGLPGNPVSAFVGFEVFVRPVLEKLSGQLDGSRLTVQSKMRRRDRV